MNSDFFFSEMLVIMVQFFHTGGAMFNVTLRQFKKYSENFPLLLCLESGSGRLDDH